jgi:hypothetical protein
VEKNKLLYAIGIYSILSIEVIKLVFINIKKIIFETFNLNYLIILKEINQLKLKFSLIYHNNKKSF